MIKTFFSYNTIIKDCIIILALIFNPSGILVAIYFVKSPEYISENFGESLTHHYKNLIS